jgi:hypothetical protein
MPDSGTLPSIEKPIAMHASAAMTPQNHPHDSRKTLFQKPAMGAQDSKLAYRYQTAT